MKDKKLTFKYIINYLSTIFTWALFIILLFCATLLLYYFLDVKIKGSKDEKYIPKFSIYTIVSGSMVPKINKYDIVINFKVDDPKDIQIGDVITFISTSYNSAGMTVTHRVVDIQIIDGQYQYITKGDYNKVEDPSAALYSNVIGKAKVKLPQLGRVQFFVASKFGWLVVVILPALYVIIKDSIKVVKLLKIKGKNKEAMV